MSKKLLVVYSVTLTALLVWIGLIFLAPGLKSRSPLLSRIIYAVFSPVCHQNSSRCFSLDGYPLAVCARCLGIYTGSLVGMLIYPAARGFKSVSLPPTKLFIILSAPIAIDTVGNFFLIWSTPGWIRFFFGWLWGLILPFYFITGVVDFLVSLNRRRNSP